LVIEKASRLRLVFFIAANSSQRSAIHVCRLCPITGFSVSPGAGLALESSALPAPLNNITARQIRGFRQRLLAWFDREQRQLPWRGETDPYRILVSEIMLQQTRVAVVEERYKLFIAQFPTTTRLARAREQTVLAAWSGLGYYRRARNLHAAAKMVEKLGAFPSTADALRELPGIGRYTAAAVASIAYGEPVAVVDGNVKRVLHRLTGRELAEEDNWRIASRLLEPSRPGDFNQAMMELGAMVCLHATPLCSRCPVTAMCVTQGIGVSREKPARLKADLRYMLSMKADKVLLRQRPKTSSLMAGMWELPEMVKSNGQIPLMRLKHSITTTDYAVAVYAGDSKDGKWVSLRGVEKLALTGLSRKILRALGNNIAV
jgi:A/G-specific adenine glycosylase